MRSITWNNEPIKQDRLIVPVLDTREIPVMASFYRSTAKHANENSFRFRFREGTMEIDRSTENEINGLARS